MSNYNENDAIPMDRPVEYEGTSIVPDGEYFFKVLKTERKQSEGGANFPAHLKMVIYLQIQDKEGNVIGTVKDDIPMFMKFIWKYHDFAKSIGVVKPDVKDVFVNWNEVPGCEGKCKVTTRKYKKTDGSEGEQNQVKYLLPAKADTSFPPAEQPPLASTAGKSGW